ncbi:hypothetical protein [Pseudomonas fluorescens]|uniref:Uncharacterized protein n=1 Tax=Pseudomonas fluorescens TaxID=294 RepID=A0A944DG58_PSEFL|nr:hypothetical protein [Pseudomonas fluorescens]MBT2298182.1 hypothetical protein [Pseudomonas fluorescens]MBT2309695.1 hypothetical protein [Pseudomonas fluorescens]MBT2314858.1 hypothetical protein [Pseudomonas fluorescens]MBT2327764.1 hypothetical protein [Pseudomonas fluorescens]MBT2345511.1 hypothetical protein [Pseudomonas fluorescens]
MYGPNPYSSDEKLFYRPIEAAIRWCGLVKYEASILEFTWDYPERLISAFPEWPYLYKNLEKILDAVRNQELRYGVLGITVPPGTPVDLKLLTIRHADLRSWMFHHYPKERPSFLFHEITPEHESISYATYLILLADRDALQVQLKSTEVQLQELMAELAAAGLERDNLRSFADTTKEISGQSKASFLNVIGALVNTILGSSESGRRHSIFDSQASIVDSITAHYGDVPGLSKRSLDEKFAAARRSLSQARP